MVPAMPSLLRHPIRSTSTRVIMNRLASIGTSVVQWRVRLGVRVIMNEVNRPLDRLVNV